MDGGQTQDEEPIGTKRGGLAPFVTPYTIRLLCNDGFQGGMGYTPTEVGDMSLDQFVLCLIDMKKLEKLKSRQTMHPRAAMAFAKDGMVKVRCADGTIKSLPVMKPKR